MMEKNKSTYIFSQKPVFFYHNSFTLYLPFLKFSVEKITSVCYNQDKISLIISDHKMPIMEGTKFLEEANLIAPDVIKILLTGFSDIEIITDAVNKCNLFQYILFVCRSSLEALKIIFFLFVFHSSHSI